MAQTDQPDRSAHRMGDEKARQRTPQLRCGELGQLRRVALKPPRSRPGRQAPRSDRTALPAPVEAPHLDAARGEISDRLELLFDEIAKPTHSTHWARASATGR